MKRLLQVCLGFILTTIFGCQSANEKSSSEHQFIEKAPSAVTDNKEYGHSFYSGLWVNQAYYKSLKKSKSPAIAFDEIGTFSTLVIDRSCFDCDSLEIGSSLGGHEGYSFNIYPNKGKNVWKTNISLDRKTTYSFHNTENLITIKEYDTELDAVRNHFFVPFINKFNNTNDAGFPLDLAIYENVLAGNYYYYDEDLIKRNVWINDYGHISGFKGYSKISVQYDFETETRPFLDVLTLRSKEDSKTYSFEKKNNDLLLFHGNTTDKPDYILYGQSFKSAVPKDTLWNNLYFTFYDISKNEYDELYVEDIEPEQKKITELDFISSNDTCIFIQCKNDSSKLLCNEESDEVYSFYRFSYFYPPMDLILLTSEDWEWTSLIGYSKSNCQELDFWDYPRYSPQNRFTASFSYYPEEEFGINGIQFYEYDSKGVFNELRIYIENGYGPQPWGPSQFSWVNDTTFVFRRSYYSDNYTEEKSEYTKGFISEL